jgi:osmotically-inducible protein OsmY
VVVAQERTIGDAIDDFTIWTQIKHLFLQKDAQDLLAGVDVEVIEGIVHLTGSVKAPETRVHAVRLAWKPRGVREVINEIHIVEKKVLTNIIRDKWVATAIKNKMLFHKGIRSFNYNIEVVEGIAYIMGIAQTEEELSKVLKLASSTKWVTKVVSHVRLKHNPDRDI